MLRRRQPAPSSGPAKLLRTTVTMVTTVTPAPKMQRGGRLRARHDGDQRRRQVTMVTAPGSRAIEPAREPLAAAVDETQGFEIVFDSLRSIRGMPSPFVLLRAPCCPRVRHPLPRRAEPPGRRQSAATAASCRHRRRWPHRSPRTTRWNAEQLPPQTMRELSPAELSGLGRSAGFARDFGLGVCVHLAATAERGCGKGQSRGSAGWERRRMSSRTARPPTRRTLTLYFGELLRRRDTSSTTRSAWASRFSPVGITIFAPS